MIYTTDLPCYKNYYLPLSSSKKAQIRSEFDSQFQADQHIYESNIQTATLNISITKEQLTYTLSHIDEGTKSLQNLLNIQAGYDKITRKFPSAYYSDFPAELITDIAWWKNNIAEINKLLANTQNLLSTQEQELSQAINIKNNKDDIAFISYVYNLCNYAFTSEDGNIIAAIYNQITGLYESVDKRYKIVSTFSPESGWTNKVIRIGQIEISTPETPVNTSIVTPISTITEPTVQIQQFFKTIIILNELSNISNNQTVPISAKITDTLNGVISNSRGTAYLLIDNIVYNKVIIQNGIASFEWISTPGIHTICIQADTTKNCKTVSVTYDNLEPSELLQKERSSYSEQREMLQKTKSNIRKSLSIV